MAVKAIWAFGFACLAGCVWSLDRLCVQDGGCTPLAGLLTEPRLGFARGVNALMAGRATGLDDDAGFGGHILVCLKEGGAFDGLASAQ